MHEITAKPKRATGELSSDIMTVAYAFYMDVEEYKYLCGET